MAEDSIKRGNSEGENAFSKSKGGERKPHGEGLRSDTGALAASIYAFAPKFNGYEKAKSESRAKLLSRYDPSDFARLLEEKVEAPKVTASSDISQCSGGIASALKYARWWEQGHDNRFTRRKEQEVFMAPARQDALDYLERRLRDRNLLASATERKAEKLAKAQAKKDYQFVGLKGKRTGTF